ncbi:f14o23.7 protein, related [Neospora caninum Liverpool]|uniref:F14o23.7 protein, related n=1 Tax=Neospora caninum (strain Liverpool) TaxID=572307 RepID=F0V972_NEOCL|nr:f14o23.7 protein, related [Neospora caninum Liverpool]CBZ50297.1 f14o23.7 protein, related [Neospora caninum Liverpool]|eukprot:XP_003880331.1 f14o23.7 protein, related [Neospora caninum Liverpool]
MKRGAVHGDERAGPTAAVELVRYLCARYRRDGEVTYLMRHRRVLVMPFPNAVGFAWNFREEVGVDVNRDFPYQRQADQCFQSVAARAISELFRTHLILGGITWHGGMRAVAYPWGSYDHSQQLGREQWQSRPSPDDEAFKSLAGALQRAGGRDLEKGDFYYPVGSMTDLVYPVNGGMEDWAYGASFEPSPDPITVCEPAPYELAVASSLSPSAPSTASASPAALASRLPMLKQSEARAEGDRFRSDEETTQIQADDSANGGDRPGAEGGARRLSGRSFAHAGEKGSNRNRGTTTMPLRGEADDGVPEGMALGGEASEEGGETESAQNGAEGKREGEAERKAKSGKGRDDADPEAKWKTADRDGVQLYAYPRSRSVYSAADIRCALFLVEMHDDKGPSRVSMGPRPVDRPTLLLPDEGGDGVQKSAVARASEESDFLTIRNVRMALKFIEKAQPDLLFTSTPPLYQPPGAVSIFAFYPVGCNVLSHTELQIRRGRCEDLLSVSHSSRLGPELLPAWHAAEVLVREVGKDLPTSCRELGVWERQGSLAEDRDRPPERFEWWGGGGNKDIALNQGSVEQKRNRVEIQYKIPPEALDGDYCSVVFASFDQDYEARSSEGNAVIVGHKTWLFPAAIPALFPVVSAAGYPLIIRGDNVEGFARLDFPLEAFRLSSKTSEAALKRDTTSDTTVQLFLNFGGNFNEERFRYDPFTGVLRYPKATNPSLSIRRVDLSVSLSRPFSSLPPGRFLFTVFEDGDLLQHTVNQFLFPASSLSSLSASVSSFSVSSSGSPCSAKSRATQGNFYSAMLLGELPTGTMGPSELERLQKTRMANFVKRQKERTESTWGGRPHLSSTWSRQVAEKLKQAIAPAVVDFSLIDAKTLRGQADVPVTALLGRTVVVQWIPESSRGSDKKEEKEGEQRGAQEGDAARADTGLSKKTGTSRVASSGYRPSQSVMAVVGASVHTPPIIHSIHEKLAPLPADPTQRSASSSPPFVSSLACFFRHEPARGERAGASLGREKPELTGARHLAGGRGSREREEGPDTAGGSDRKVPEQQMGEEGGRRAEETASTEKREAGDMEAAPEAKTTVWEGERERDVEASERDAARTLLGNLIGYLRLTYTVDSVGEQRKENLEEGGGSGAGRVRVEAELCETSMGIPADAPLYLKFHEDCCPPLTMYPSTRQRLQFASQAQRVPEQRQSWLGRFLGVRAGDTANTKTAMPPEDETGSWELPEGTANLLSLRNCRCGPGTIVTLATEVFASSLHASSSFSPFSSNTFFLPPADMVDSAHRRTLACALGLVPPVPGQSSEASRHDETSNRLPFSVSLTGGEPSIAASPFISRFICGSSSRPSWRQWSKRPEAAARRSASTESNKEGHQTQAEEDVADFIAFFEAAEQAREDHDMPPKYHLVIASLIALIGLVCILSPCLISVYDCCLSHHGVGGMQLSERPSERRSPFNEYPEIHAAEGEIPEIPEGEEESPGGSASHTVDRFGRLVDAFAEANSELNGDRQAKKEDGKAIVAKSNLFSSRLRGVTDDEVFNVPSSLGHAVVSTAPRRLSGGTGKRASYEPFFSIAGEDDDSEEDEGGFQH